MPEKAQLSKGEQTRTGIIEAAYSVFLEKGYHGASMRQIAERANVALGGIYNHFASKEEIFKEVFLAYNPWRKIISQVNSTRGETL